LIPRSTSTEENNHAAELLIAPPFFCHTILCIAENYIIFSKKSLKKGLPKQQYHVKIKQDIFLLKASFKYKMFIIRHRSVIKNNHLESEFYHERT
jgi:hypothetical protein